MKIGLICEGITDYITLENILCGFFKGKLSDEDIYQLQPALDETDQKQAKDSFGGWEPVLSYLKSSIFIDAAVNHDYLAVQIDTDICEHPNFGVSPITLAQENPEHFYQLIKEKLIENINITHSDNFSLYGEKVIFCICIHSLECWLLAHYQSPPAKSPKIIGCEAALYRLLDKQKTPHQKNYNHYDKISRPFLERENIQQASEKSLSFNLFIQQLNRIKIS